MENYWVTFRIKSDETYQRRYDDMLAAMIKIRASSWGEPTSFWLVKSNLDIGAFTQALAVPLNPRTDLLVVRYLAKDGSRYFGSPSHPDVLKQFLPHIIKSP